MTDIHSVFESLYCSNHLSKDEWKSTFRSFFLSHSSSSHQEHSKCATSIHTKVSEGSPPTSMDFMDDLVFLVGEQLTLTSHDKSRRQSNEFDDPPIQVMRREQCRKKIFSNSDESPPYYEDSIHWKSTFYLNIIVQYIQYNLVLAICEQTSSTGSLRLLRRFDTKMYASPTRRRLDTKGHQEEMVYPFIYFMLDTFDETLEQCNLHESELFYVELVAYDPSRKHVASLFRRFVKYETLDAVLTDAKVSRSNVPVSVKSQKANSISSNMRNRDVIEDNLATDASLFYQRTDTHFFPCLGSEGKGCVELAVHKTYPTLPKTSTCSEVPATASSSRFRMSGMGSLFWSGTGVRKSRSDMNLLDRKSATISPADSSRQLFLETSEGVSAGGSSRFNRFVDQAWSWFTSSTYEPTYSDKSDGKPLSAVTTPTKESCSTFLPSPYINMAITYISIPCDEILRDFFKMKRPPKLRLQ